MSRETVLNGSSHLPHFERPLFNLRPPEPSQETLRSIPDLIRFNAIHNPQFAFCYQSSGSGDQLQYEPFSFEQFAAAVGNCCGWILDNVVGTTAGKRNVGGAVSKGRPVALFMENDISLLTYVCALLALNIPCVLLSIRLSPAALHNLLRTTSTCSIISSPRLLANIVHSVSPEVVSAICAAPISKDVSSLPDHLRLFDMASALVEENDINVIMLHSSGTTGLPKPIWLSQRYLLGYAACHEFPAEVDESQRGLNLSTLPIYHGFGFLAPSLALSVGKPVCFLPTSTIPNGGLVARMLTDTRIHSLMTVPTIMEELMALPNKAVVTKLLQGLDFIAVGGGGMKELVCSWFESHQAPLLNHFGSTELGALAPIFRPYKDYNPRFLPIRKDMGLRLEFEHSVSAQQQAIGSRLCRLVGNQFGSNQEYVLPDALEFNPLKPNDEVRILGRRDDVLVLASGEKVMATLIEREIEQCKSVRRAVVLGQHQFEIGLLIEPVSTRSSPDSIIEDVWPYIEKANAIADRHARIQRKEAILIKRADSVIPLSDKGSIQRSELYEAFKVDIADLYRRLDSSDSSGLAIDPSAANVKDLIGQLAQKCLPEYHASENLDDDADFIRLGMDSLQITHLRQLLDACLRKYNPLHQSLARDFVYSHPSVRQIVAGLSVKKTASGPEDRISNMTRMLLNAETFSKLTVPPSKVSPHSVILITGASGSLGCHLLQALSSEPDVCRIICLIRSKKTQETELREKQLQALHQRGISLPSASWAKVGCIAWDTSKDLFGLCTKSYQDLVENVTHVFHGAWPLDFQWKLESFSPNFRHVGQLFDLAQRINNIRPHIKVKICLASSVAVVAYTNKTLVAEAIVDGSATTPIGYAEAKWVCEKLFEKAGDCRGDVLDPVIVRIGQLTGARQSGQWNTAEHVPALIQSAQKLGVFPDIQGTLSWLPVDQAAAAISEILLHRGQTTGIVYHIENPIRQHWSDVITAFERSLRISIPRIPFADWLRRAIAEKSTQPNLADFFGHHFQHLATGGVILDTHRARLLSRTLCEVGGVTLQDIDAYLEHWKSVGFI